jgi:hypothetical protein
MVIEMLLNNDIQHFFVEMILNFQKEINVIKYIIENKIWIFKVYVFVMFKMKYLINRM